jgi:predicted protein tyrosine phosphatase
MVRLALVHAKLASSDGQPAFVVPGRLCIGGAGAAYNKAGLRAAEVTHVLTLCRGVALPASADLGLICKRVAFEDVHSSAASFDAEFLDECLAFISDALQHSRSACVLVHCYQGRSRSAAVVCAYLAQTGTPLQEAYSIVRAVRPHMLVNSGFAAVLQRRYCSCEMSGVDVDVEDGDGADESVGVNIGVDIRVDVEEGVGVFEGVVVGHTESCGHDAEAVVSA